MVGVSRGNGGTTSPRVVSVPLALELADHAGVSKRSILAEGRKSPDTQAGHLATANEECPSSATKTETACLFCSTTKKTGLSGVLPPNYRATTEPEVTRQSTPPEGYHFRGATPRSQSWAAGAYLRGRTQTTRILALSSDVSSRDIGILRKTSGFQPPAPHKPALHGRASAGGYSAHAASTGVPGGRRDRFFPRIVKNQPFRQSRSILTQTRPAGLPINR
jgi:hypothetical protein